MFNITYSLIKFEIRFNKEAKLNINKESSISGTLGKVLIDIYCIRNTDDVNCKKCYFKSKCIAANVKETRLKSTLGFLAEDSAAPVIFECNDDRVFFKMNDTLNFTICLAQTNSIPKNI